MYEAMSVAKDLTAQKGVNLAKHFSDEMIRAGIEAAVNALRPPATSAAIADAVTVAVKEATSGNLGAIRDAETPKRHFDAPLGRG
jgi:hypothetical protein